MSKRGLNFLETHKIIPIILVILIASTIFYLSNKSYPVGPATPDFWKAKLYHASIFFLLTFFLLAVIKQGKLKPVHLLFALVLSFLYACLDELHQFFIPFRHSTFNDVMIDSIGIMFAVFFYTLLSYQE